MICPTCKGEKKIGGMACPGFRYVEIPCWTCKGTGDCSEEQAKVIERGKKLRKKRLASDRSLREEANRLGMSTSAYSDLEHGRAW